MNVRFQLATLGAYDQRVPEGLQARFDLGGQRVPVRRLSSVQIYQRFGAVAEIGGLLINWEQFKRLVSEV